MRTKSLLLLLIALVLSGCGYGRFISTRAPNSCGGTGYAIAGVYYGDSRIWVVPITNLKPGAEFRLKLLPKIRKKTDAPLIPRELKVTIEGDVANDAGSAWIEKREGTFNSSTRGFLDPICVPNNQSLTTYKYKISVDGVGVLDPRARVY